jgi:hypothetical protein
MDKEVFKKIIEIRCLSNEEKMKVGTLIHEQLAGNKDYIDSNIVLNIDEDCKVILIIYPECEEEPRILI